MTEERFEVSRLVREIQSAAAERRASGDVPGELEPEIEDAFRRFIPSSRVSHKAERMNDVIHDAWTWSQLDADVPTASERALFVPIKRGIKAAIGWYVTVVVGQVRGFMDATVKALKVTRDVVDSVEDRIDELEAQVDELQRRLDARDS